MTDEEIVSTIMESSQYQADKEALIGSAVQQTTSNLAVRFNTIEAQQAVVDGKMETINNVESWFKFNNDGTFDIGKSDSPFSVKLGTEKLQFMKDDKEMAYFQNNTLYNSAAEISNRLKLGNFTITVTDDGDTLVWN